MNQETPNALFDAKWQVGALELRNKALFRYMESIEITNRDQQKNSEQLLIDGRAALKEAEIKRKELITPLRAEEKYINDTFKRFTSRIELGLARIDNALKVYHAEQRKLAEAKQIEQMVVAAEARETGEIVELQPAPPVGKTSHTYGGSVTYREDYDIQIVDMDAVPRDLCVPDMVRIRARVKSGITSIPGVLVTKKLVTVARPG